MNAKLLFRSRVQFLRTLSAFLVIILTACAGPVSGVAVDWDVANEPNVVVTYAPTASRPTLAVTQATMIRATTLSPSVSASSTAVPSVTLTYDERGRVIGGAMPVINYSPTMITGKPCPRVTEWGFELVKSPVPFQDYGISKNPCVVQNAVDDLVRTLWFNPAFQTPQTMAKVEIVYDSDPMNVLGVEKTLRDSLIRNFRTGRQNYNDCDKPVYRYLHVDANAALLADNDGRVSGKAIQIILLRTTEDRQSFTCQFVSYGNGSVNGKFEVTEDMLRGKLPTQATVYRLLWISRQRHWQIYFSEVIPIVSCEGPVQC